MATIITLPKIIGLDKELCVPEGNQRLWNYFGVEGYSVKHSKIFEPHLFMPTNKANLPYQKMVDRYQFLTSDGVKPQCEPLCPEGWYFDCETETCKACKPSYFCINCTVTAYYVLINYNSPNSYSFSQIEQIVVPPNLWHRPAEGSNVDSYLATLSSLGANITSNTANLKTDYPESLELYFHPGAPWISGLLGLSDGVVSLTGPGSKPYTATYYLVTSIETNLVYETKYTKV